MIDLLFLPEDSQLLLGVRYGLVFLSSFYFCAILIASWVGTGSNIVDASTWAILIAIFTSTALGFALGPSIHSMWHLQKVVETWRLPSLDCALIKEGQQDIVGPGVVSICSQPLNVGRF